MASSSLVRWQKGMRLLGWLHFLLAAFLLVMFMMMILAGPEQLGAIIHEKKFPVFSGLEGHSDEIAGLSVMILMVVFLGMEIFLGFSCRRKARHPEKLLFTLLFSGFRVIWALFTIVRTGFANVDWSDTGFTLALNLATFLLALQMKLGKTEQSAGTE